MVNIFADRFLALMNNISVGWHLLGIAVIIGLLIYRAGPPSEHRASSSAHASTSAAPSAAPPAASASGSSSPPIGFLLTMYTQTGYDASAHTAEETQGAAISAAQGVWRSIFFSAIIGWLLLLAFLYAATNVTAIDDSAARYSASSTPRSTPGPRRWWC